MRFLRTNTAVIVTVGPFYDKTDGVTIETALTITNERITLTADTDAGSAPTNILDNVTGATSGTSNDLNYITGNDAGMMQLELAAADTNRLGRMMLSITDAANHVPVFHEFMVLPAMIYDAFVLGTDVLDSSMTQILGAAVSSPATAGILDVNVKNIDNDAASASGTVTFPNATLASTSNITGGTITTVTNLTNAPTAGDLTATMKTSVGTAVAASAVASVTGNVGGSVASIASGGISEASFATAAGSFAPLGVIDQGTAQAATGTTLQLRSAAAFADGELVGAVVFITGGSAGVGQARTITGYVGSTDTATVDTWTTTPTGTITYKVLASPPGPVALTQVDVTKWNGTAVASPATAGIPEVNVKNWNNLAAVELPLVPTTAGRKLDVSAGGEAGVDWANVGSPTTTVNLSGTTVKTATDVETDTQDIQARLPAALVSGRIDSSVGAMAANVLTATAINADAFTAAKFASDVTTELQTGLATASALSSVASDVTSILTAVDTEVGAIKTVTDRLNNTLESTSDGYIFSANALQQAPSGTGASAATIAAAVWDEALASHSISGSTGEALDAAGTAGDPWLTSLPGAYGAGTAGKIIGDNITGNAFTRLGAPAGASLAADVAAVKVDTAAVKVQTDKMVFTVTNQLDVNVIDWKGATAPAMTGDAFARLGAPAGASVSADIAAAKVDTAAVKVKTDFLPSAAAGAAGGVFIAGANAATSITTALTANVIGNVTGNLSGSVGSVTGLTASDVGAIKAKTDNLPAAPAAVGDIPSAAANAAAVMGATVEGSTTLVQSVRLANSALGGKASGLASTSVAYRDLADTKDRIAATVDADGNRSAITRDLT